MAAKTKINLLSQDFKPTRGLGWAKKASFIISGLYILVLLLLFGLSYFLSMQKKSSEAKAATLTTRIASLKKNEELLLLLKNRVAVSQTAVSKSGASPTDSLQKILSAVPEQIQVISVRAENDGTTTILCKAQNSKDITDFFNILKEKKYATVFLTAFALGDDGHYNFNLTLN